MKPVGGVFGPIIRFLRMKKEGAPSVRAFGFAFCSISDFSTCNRRFGLFPL